MADAVQILSEPLLEFGLKQRLEDPHDGLGLFGPCDLNSPSHKKSIVYAMVGPPDEIDSFSQWSKANSCGIVLDQTRDNPNNRPMNPRLWSAFPGFEAAFDTLWPESPVTVQELDR